MSDDLATLAAPCRPTRDKPLMGLTLLAVEDSRYASEALRLMCRHSGARLRRADCLASARRHLGVYRPGAVLIDLGLPDGSGLDLIRDLSRAATQGPVIIATSGDVSLHDAALEAGAAGFLAKPVATLGEFQQALLAHLPDANPWPRVVPSGSVSPDMLALRDDLVLADQVLSAPGDSTSLDYLAQFLTSVGHSAGDADLRDAAQAFARDRAEGIGTGHNLTALAGLVRARLSEAHAI